MNMAKYFDIVVNPNDETGFDFNSVVDRPAHELETILFNKQTRYSFDDEKRIITGVAIAANKWIYRYSEEHGDHYVRFTPETIELMNLKNSKNNMFNMLNLNHDSTDIAKGVYLIANYIVSNSNPKYPNVPDAFSKQGIENGSLIRSYKVESDEMWERFKKDNFGGFSIEGLFEKVEIKTKIKMKKQNKSIWDLLKTAAKGSDKFATATTADGVVISYEGELVEGTAVFVELEGEKVPAPAGEYQLTWEDGNVTVITVDDNGLVVSVAPVEMDNNEEEEMQEIRQEVADAIAQFASQVNERFESMEAKNATLESENQKLKAEIETFKTSGKFGAQPKKTGTEEKRMTISDIVKNKKS